jgi:N-acetylmuramoyl-L-alanine amidase
MNTKLLLGSLLFFFLVCLSWASSNDVRVKSVRWGDGPQARLLVDFSGTPSYHITPFSHVPRLAIDVSDAASTGNLPQPPTGHPVAAGLKAASGKDGDGLRLVVDLKAPAEAKSHIENLKDGVRLVIEWPDTQTGRAEAPARTAAPIAQKPVRTAHSKPVRPFIVAIDAGHGGKDTGAIGPTGVREKDVVLAIARKLAGYIQAEPGMRAVLIRSGDHFVDLHHRAQIARKAKADLFVSLHADAYQDGEVRGSSVFTLSETGASSEAARWVADRENAALLGGVKLKDKSKTLASVLVDLSKNATLEASDQAAGKVLRELGRSHPTHHADVQKAGFAVLKSLDVPSMLVETAFISNPAEERNLATPRHQEQLARAVFRGIRAYAAETRTGLPAGTRVADAE